MLLAPPSGTAAGRCVVCHTPQTEDTGAATIWLYPASLDTPTTTPGTAPTQGDGSSPPPVERTLGRYVLKRLLGRGGMGVVYDAWDPVLDRPVALKILLAGGFATAQARRALEREARAGARPMHPNIVRVLDIGETNGQPFFAMERIDGCSLAHLLRTCQHLPDSEAVRICTVVGHAIQAAHDAGIAHRDLKPGNILVDTAGTPYVVDFGIAKVLDGETSRASTAAGAGTPAFMAPEVCIDRGGVDWVRVDVYGVGAILFACLTGTSPTPGDTPAQQLSSLVAGRQRDVQAERPDLDPRLADIVHMAIHPDPSARYDSAKALVDDLDQYRVRGHVVARRARPSRWRPADTGPRFRVAVGALAAVVMVGAVGGWVWSRRDAEATARETAAMAAYDVVQARLGTLSSREAAEELATFAQRPATRGTRASGLARLAQGDLLWQAEHATRDRLPTFAQAMEAWSSALPPGLDPEVRGSALVRFARQAWRDNAQARLVAAVQAMGPTPRVLPVDAAEARHWAIVASLLDGERSGALGAWQAARAAGDPLRFAHPDRVAPLLAGGIPVTRGGGDGHGAVPVQSGRVPESLRFVDGPEPRVVVAPPASDEDRASWVDLDGDGRTEGYLQQGRTTLRLDHTADGIEARPAPFDVRLDRTGYDRLTSADLDGDGAAELLIAAGEWEVYDLRVLDAGDDGRPRLRGRATRAMVWDTATLPLHARPGAALFTSEAAWYPNHRVFGPVTPRGPDPAIVLWSLEEQGLVSHDSWILPYPSGITFRGALDIDADGREELFFDLGSPDLDVVGVVWLAEDDAAFSVSLVPGLRALGTVRGSQHRGLLVEPAASDGALWLIGPDLPPRADRPMPRGPAAPATEGALPSETAALLVELGLPILAAHRLEDESRFQTSEAAVASLEGAARLWASEGHVDEAATAWTRAASTGASRSPTARDAAWTRAVQAWLTAADPHQAIETADAWAAAGGAPNGALADTLDGWRRARASTVAVSADAPLPGALTLDRPTAVRAGADGLVVHTATQATPAASFAVTLQPGPVAVFVDLVVLEDTWSSGLAVTLLDDEGAVRAWVARSAGGGFIDRTIRCDSPTREGWQTLRASVRDDGPTLDGRIRLVRDADGAWRCAVRVPADRRSSVVDVPEGPGDGPARLELGAAFAGEGRPSALQTARIDRLEVWGATWGPDADDARSRGNRALADGDLHDALATLPTDAHVARALALAQLGRPMDAIASLRRARAQGSLQGATAELLRIDAELTTPLVQEAMGDAFPDAAFAAWEIPLGDEGVGARDLEVLWRSLQGSTLTAARSADTWWVTARVAEGLLAAGRTERGEVSAERWLASFDALPLASHPAEIRARAAALHRALRTLALARGDAAAAEAHAAASVEVSVDTLIAGDRLTR